MSASTPKLAMCFGGSSLYNNKTPHVSAPLVFSLLSHDDPNIFTVASPGLVRFSAGLARDLD
eukprot:3360411-Lingulodinium_polyedra.AAC.1